MQFYSKEALQQVYDQVNRDNPQLPVVLTPSIAALTKGPISKSEQGRNTQVVFTGFPGTGVQGNVTLYYDRINLTTLINFTPRLYLPISVKTVREALPYFSDALGIKLIPEDFTAPDTALTVNAAEKTLTLTISTASPAYTGKLVISYICESNGLYPNSGPGPKELRIGDRMAGYFGIVPASELFTRDELIAICFKGVTAPPAYATAAGWYKFFYRGGTIYIPQMPIASTMDWNTLYNLGLVYGIEGVGAFPTTTPVTQSRILTKDTSEGRFYLRPRLPSVSVVDPVVDFSATGIAGTEFELMARMRDEAQWGNFSTGDWGVLAWMTNTLKDNTAYAARPSMGGSSFGGSPKTQVYYTLHWWPVLELVDTSTVVLGLEEVIGSVDNTIGPVPFTGENTMTLHPVILGNPKTVDYRPVIFQADNSMSLAPAILGLPRTVDFQPIAFTTERIDPPQKTDLATLNGELPGF